MKTTDRRFVVISGLPGSGQSMLAQGLLLASLVLLVATAQAEQTARPNAPPLARPAYESGKGPVVAIDEAHKNTHTFTSPPFRGFVELLQLDGYRPRAFAQTIAAPSLNGIDVLVVSGPGG